MGGGLRWWRLGSRGGRSKALSHAGWGAAVLPAPPDRLLGRGLGARPLHVPAGAEPVGVPAGPGGRALRRHAGVAVRVTHPRRAVRREGGERCGIRGPGGGLDRARQGPEQPR